MRSWTRWYWSTNEWWIGLESIRNGHSANGSLADELHSYSGQRILWRTCVAKRHEKRRGRHTKVRGSRRVRIRWLVARMRSRARVTRACAISPQRWSPTAPVKPMAEGTEGAGGASPLLHGRSILRDVSSLSALRMPSAGALQSGAVDAAAALAAHSMHAPHARRWPRRGRSHLSGARIVLHLVGHFHANNAAKGGSRAQGGRWGDCRAWQT